MTGRAARFLILFVAALALAGAFGPWAPAALAFDAARVVPAAPPVQTDAITANGYRARVAIGEAVVERARVYGFDVAEVLIPGGHAESERGVPSLPSRTVLLRVPWGVTPVVRGARSVERSLGALEPSPIPRLVVDPGVRARTAPEDVAAAMGGPRYRALGGSLETPVVSRVALVAAGNERLLAVTVRAVTWDGASREARVAEEIVLDLSWERPVAPLAGSEASAVRGTRGGSLVPDEAAGPRYAARTRGGALAPGRMGAAAAVGPLRVDPSRPWVRLGVVRPGLYRVTPADLTGAGVVTSGIDPATFRLFRATPGDLPESVDVDLGPDSLRECAITVLGESDNVFDASDAIYFYGTGATGFGYDLRAGGGPEYEEQDRSDEQTNWLTWGPGPLASPPRRIPLRDAAPTDTSAPLLTAVTHRVHYEENRVDAEDLFQAGVRWERWFRLQISQGARIAFPVSLPGAVPDGAAAARARMWGSGGSLGQPDHIARLYWGTTIVDTVAWDFSEARDLNAEGLRTNGVRDTVQIEVPRVIDPSDPGRLDIQYHAWFEITYPRALIASADTLTFAAPDSLAPGSVRYAIGAISDTAAAWLLDRTNPETPVRLVNGTWSGVTPAFQLTVQESVGLAARRRYSLVSTARAARPFRIARFAPVSSAHTLNDLLDPANAADYLILAPPAFLAAAESLAAERAGFLHGLPNPRTAVATTDRVFAQLGAGLPDAVAIRNLLAYAGRYWAASPQYVCLIGDASEDPKNYSGLSVIDWIPSFSKNFDTGLRVQYTTDDFFGFLDGPSDQLLDLVIGRIPARDPVDATVLVTGKRRTYERTQDFDFWRTRSLLVADDAWKWSLSDKYDLVGRDHVLQMERKDAFHLPFPVRREKVYLNDYAFSDSFKTSKPKAREAFLAGVNAGNWLVDFIGHGNENILADEQVFRSIDAPRLTNAARPSIFGFFSCAVGWFDNIRGDPMAEVLLRQPTGGAAVCLASSHEAFGTESTQLNDDFVDELFPLSPRVDSLRTAGKAWAFAKNSPGNQNVVVRKYAYLGEPGLVPPLPRGLGVWEKSPQDSVLRGEVAVLRGHAVYFDSTATLADNPPDTLSSGTVLFEVLGPPSLRIQTSKNNFGILVPVPYFLPGPLLYRGEAALDRGAFELRFVVPTDGRVIGRGAQIRALLSSAGGRGVGLAADSIRIASGLSPRTDATPPTIRLRYVPGDSTLSPGSLLTIEIEDSSGVDLTGLDNAHRIFVVVDDRGTPIDLTHTFRYEPGSFTRGTATLTIPQLGGGAHLLEVHASDTYRNVAVATFTIDVTAGTPPGSALTMTEVFNYPNPFPNETYLHARLNQPARLRVQILTVAGRRVRDFTIAGTAGENYIPWDGRDSEGEKVAVGVYLCKLTAEASGGSRVTAVARALRAE